MLCCLLTEVCIISSCKPLFAAWSAFSLPGIPVWAGIQLIVGICVNLDAASLMALVIVLKYRFLLLSVFTAVKESVCIVILSLVSLSSPSANRSAVISASSTDAESLSLMIISSFFVYNRRRHPCPVTRTVCIVRVVVWLRTYVC